MSVLVASTIIFLFRTADIACETIRTIMVVKGMKWTVAAISFVEVLLWVWMFNEIVSIHKHWACYLAYASGYSLGSWVGILLGHKFIKNEK